MKGKFFMDVHPPLAKLLITLAGWLAGFDGNFDFKEIGKDYLEPGVPYVAMRMLPALLGITVVPSMFLTLKAAGCSTTSSVLGAGLIIFGQCLWKAPRNRDMLTLDARERTFNSIPSYPLGLAFGCFHGLHSSCLDLLPQRPRTRTLASVFA